jgi:hypothetical protein
VSLKCKLLIFTFSTAVTAYASDDVPTPTPYSVQDEVIPQAEWAQTPLVFMINETKIPVHTTIQEYVDSTALVFEHTSNQRPKVYRAAGYTAVARILADWRSKQTLMVDWYPSEVVAAEKAPLDYGYITQRFAIPTDLNDIPWFEQYKYFQKPIDFLGYGPDSYNIFAEVHWWYEQSDVPVILYKGISVDKESGLGRKITRIE